MTGQNANRVIREAAHGFRNLTEADLRPLLAHVAGAGFDPLARERARGELAGIRWQGRVLQGHDRLPPSVRHFLKHVVMLQEWPHDTNLARYVSSLREVIEDPSSGIFTSSYQGEAQLGAVRASRDLRGPEGFDWVLVEYRVSIGHWVTGYQPRGGLNDLASSMRADLRWWREPMQTYA